MPTPFSRRSLAQIQQAFLTALPRIQAHGEVYFRKESCPGRKADYLAEMAALSWKWWLRLVRKGKEPSRFVSALATFAARAVKSGRRVCGQEKARDVLSPVAQRRKGLTVCKLPDFSTLSSNVLTEALHDSTKSPPDEAAIFRIDFPNWLSSLGDSKRRLAEDLMMGERTTDVAQQHGYSPGRISQLRRELMESWQDFCGDGLDA